jgi:uncharacterized membrane protein YfcA
MHERPRWAGGEAEDVRERVARHQVVVATRRGSILESAGGAWSGFHGGATGVGGGILICNLTNGRLREANWMDYTRH